MNLIGKNIKVAGIFNIVLIIIAFKLQIDCLNMHNVSFVETVLFGSCSIATIFGLLYFFFGYKKDAAKYYKVFMYLFFISSLLSVIGDFVSGLIFNLAFINLIAFIFNFIKLVAVAPLAFIKDFGKKRSFTCLYVALGAAVLMLVIGLLFYFKDETYMAICVNDLLVTCLASIFIYAKYKDKDSRGTK